MKCLIREIGVIDKNFQKHFVTLKSGLNVITGRSSTGKSALIEIFDYCLGSGEFSVPIGVITDHSKYFYVVLMIRDRLHFIARQPHSRKIFWKMISEDFQNKKYEEIFTGSNEYTLVVFKDMLRNFFINIEDVNESLISKEYTGRSAPRPSIRSFSSFILQHQNLIANKHALFYRFDQQEKREQIINLKGGGRCRPLILV